MPIKEDPPPQAFWAAEKRACDFTHDTLAELAHDLKALRKDLADHRVEVLTHMAEVKVDIAKLQVKAGVWGGLAGLIPAIGTFLFWKSGIK